MQQVERAKDQALAAALDVVSEGVEIRNPGEV
jgi:hypothetical protein